MKFDIEFTVETVHMQTGRRQTFSVKASDVRDAVNKLFHPAGFTFNDDHPNRFTKLNRDHFHILKVVQREV